MKNPIKIVKGQIVYFCNTCKRWLPETKFNKDNTNLHNNRGGLCTQCKDCQRARYYKDRQRLLEDDYLALKYKLSTALKGSKRRSKEKNLYNDLDIEFLLYLWSKQNGKCALTDVPMTYKFYEGRVNTNLSIDRIDSAKGYTRDNVQLVTMAANQMKNDLTIDELVDMCKRIIEVAGEK